MRNIVVSYGGGVNSIALLVWLSRSPFLGEVRAITMADPGSERQATIRYRDEVMPDWLRKVGLPQITVLTRKEEGAHRPRAWRLETLEEECLRINSLPSVAYGKKKCSAKYKIEPQHWWLDRQPWAQEVWARGEKLTKVIGYDADELVRVDNARDVSWRSKQESARFEFAYPLAEHGFTRIGCIDLIASAGLPPASKSACTFCPNNQMEEWAALRIEEPEAFERAVAMSRQAVVENPRTVGLMRYAKPGKRQLHVWADGGYPDLQVPLDLDPDDTEEMPCECGT